MIDVFFSAPRPWEWVAWVFGGPQIFGFWWLQLNPSHEPRSWLARAQLDSGAAHFFFVISSCGLE